MATVHVVLASVMPRIANGALAPIPASNVIEADTVTTTAASAQATPTGEPGQVWIITALGSVYANFGTNPTAAADSGWLIASGQTREFAVSSPAELCALKDAS
jgi:hypothetical protein